MIKIGDGKEEIRKEQNKQTASLVGSTFAVKLMKLCPITLVFGENFCCDRRRSSLD